jgi:RNA polymerase sigma-70 factor (ECF subfamily)
MSELMTTGGPSPTELDRRLDEHRAAITAHCRRMLRCPFDADDAVQETFVRAWRSYDRFEGRATLQTWLYRIATNVCLDQIKARRRQPRPADLATWPASGGPPGAAGPAPTPAGLAPTAPGPSPGHGAPDTPLTDGPLTVTPLTALTAAEDPAERAVELDTVRRAFVAALLRLPPRQRSVLLLRDVLRWRATEVAELLGTSVASVNSSLQRARATLAEVRDPEETGPMDDEQRALLERCTDAFGRYDVDSLVSLLR